MKNEPVIGYNKEYAKLVTKEQFLKNYSDKEASKHASEWYDKHITPPKEEKAK